ncbi:MAG TPA: hypothetical protein VIN67_06740, partial [Desulfobaccales bacterium]
EEKIKPLTDPKYAFPEATIKRYWWPIDSVIKNGYTKDRFYIPHPSPTSMEGLWLGRYRAHGKPDRADVATPDCPP